MCQLSVLIFWLGQECEKSRPFANMFVCCLLQLKSKVVISKDPNVVSSQEEEEDVAKGLCNFSV